VRGTSERYYVRCGREKNLKFGALMFLRECPLVLLVRIGRKRSRAFEGEGNEVMGVGLGEHTAQESILSWISNFVFLNFGNARRGGV